MTVISVRGTDAVGGLGPRNGRVWTTGGAGPIISSVLSKFDSEPIPIKTVSLVYPAAGGASYGTSVATGISNLTNEVNWLMNVCPVRPMIMLIGHSQGAQVIVDALASGRFSSLALSQIKGVALFGDPAYQAFQPIAAPGNGTGQGLWTRGYQTQIFLNNFKNSWGEQKIRSWCYTGDQFCQSGLGANAGAIHNSYLNSSSRKDEAFAWMRDMYSW